MQLLDRLELQHIKLVSAADAAAIIDKKAVFRGC
jgi:hypothetical protein